jgi:predicted RNase H-related nuclease YkuK (DUF458 family)
MPEGALQYKEIEYFFHNAKWKTSSGKVTTFEEIIDLIDGTNCDIYVGADSNPAKVPNILAASIAIVKKNEFARYFYCKNSPWKNRIPSLVERLNSEVVLSCYIAGKIRDHVPEYNIIVHADVNSNPLTPSGKYAIQFKRYIKAFGFDAFIKPLSWAASSIADKYAD